MKLKDLDTSGSQKIAQVYESQAGKKINVSALGSDNARVMLKKVRNTIAEHNEDIDRRYNRHNSEVYTKLMVLEQALVTQIAEYGSPMPSPTGPAANAMSSPAASTANKAPAKPNAKDPKVKMAMDKAARGQSLNPEEQKMMNAIALQQNESQELNAQALNEDEMQQAQVVLAAQDMVDSVQKMIEDISATLYKDLNALTASASADIGADQAANFQAQASGALETLLGSLQTAKTGLEGAMGNLTGNPMVVPGENDMELDVDAEVDTVDGEEEIDLDVEADSELDPDVEAEVAALGREKRA